MVLSQDVQSVLMRAGWWPERAIDLTQHRSAWEAEGYVPSDAALNLVASIGGLSISHEGYAPGNDMDQSIFDPQRALDTIFTERVQGDYELRTKEPLCPVGVGFSEHLVYLVSASGKMYGGFDGYLCRIGSNLNESLRNIFFDHKFEAL